MLNQTLANRYTLTARIGSGAMGTVYRAADSQTGKEVAVKAIARDLAFDPEMLERFRREGEALRQLRHPNIVEFIDAFRHEEQYVIVMEYVPGGSLHELLKAGSLPIDRARAIALELCDALTRAHHLNVIHRDIKPENVLVAEDGTPKLTDFGMARLVRESRQLTGSGARIGTPYYMSPEAWEGKPLDAQADIWSLGVVLFEMLSGQVPFGGDTLVAVMNKVLTAPLPDLKELRPDAPPGLAEITQRMLVRDKAARYQTMREVGADLERGQLLMPSRAAPVPSTPPSAAAPPVTLIRPARSGWQWSVVGMALGAVGVIAVLLFAARALFFGNPTPAPTAEPNTPAAPLIPNATQPSNTETAIVGGSISGVVTQSENCADGKNYPIEVGANRFDQPPGPSAYSMWLSEPGPYALLGVADGKYWVFAIMYCGGRQPGPSQSGDLYGQYVADVIVSNSGAVSGVNLDLRRLPGGQTTVSTSVPGPSAVATGTTAVPTTMVGGSISGVVTQSENCADGKNYPIEVGANAFDQPPGPSAYSMWLSEPGPYTLSGIADGKYWVFAIMYCGGRQPGPSQSGDLFGEYVGAITISNGTAVTGINIELRRLR